MQAFIKSLISAARFKFLIFISYVFGKMYLCYIVDVVLLNLEYDVVWQQCARHTPMAYNYRLGCYL